MRELDMKIEAPAASAEVLEATSAPAAAPKPAPSDLLDAHDLLLKEFDEVRQFAKLVTDKIAALEMQLAPREAAHVRQGEMLERVARTTLAEAGKEWAATAVQYRTLVDELARLAA